MICRNCGNEMNDNEKICPACGANNVNFPDDNSHADKKPGIFSKKKTVFALAIVLVLLVAVVAFAGDAIKNFAYRTVLSPSSYLKYVQEKNMDEVADAIDELDGLLESFDRDGKNISVDVGIAIGDRIKNLITQNAEPEALPYINWINELSLGIDAKQDSPISGAEADIAINGTHITNAKFVSDLSDGHIYVSLPDISDKAIRFDTGYTDFSYEMNQIKNLMKIIPDEDVVSDLLCRYVGIVTSQMKNVTRSKATVTSDGISQKCTQLTVAIDGETTLNILKAVLTEAKDDAVLKKLISDFAGFYGENPEEAIKHYDEEIADVLEAVATEEPPQFDEIPYIDLWVDNSADIIGGAFRYDPVEISISFAEALAKNAMSLSVKTPEATFEVNGSSENKSGKMNGKYIALLNGMNIVEVITENIDEEKLEDGELEGKITISVADAASGLLAMTGADAQMQKLVSDGRLELEANKSKISLSLYTGSELIGGISLSEKKAKNIDLSIPQGYVEDTDSEEWTKTIRIDKIIGNLVKAGAPKELSVLASLMTAQPTAEMTGVDSAGFLLE